MNEVETKTKKEFYKRWWFIVLVVLVFIIVGSTNDLSEKKKANDLVEKDKQTNLQKEVFKIGDQIKSGDSFLTVTKITKNWKSSNQFDKPSSPNDVYVLVDVLIENKGSKDLSLSGMWDFKLEDSNGLQRSQAIGGVGIKQLPSGELSPNGKATGEILFEADKSALNVLKLRYKPLFSSTKEVVIELQ